MTAMTGAERWTLGELGGPHELPIRVLATS
jgi:hypothetical protein